jgi:hypothetical protein
MLKVKTFVKRSNIHGFGLFANEDIPEGTIIWEFNEEVDEDITENYKDYYNQDHVSKINNRYYIFTDARYMNHSDNNNISYTEGIEEAKGLANRFICKGEELTENYKLLYDDDCIGTQFLKNTKGII